MKYLIIAMALLMSYSNASAESGQSGSGGNGCFVSSGNVFYWRSFEELAFPNHFYRYTVSTFNNGGARRSAPPRVLRGQIRVVNMNYMPQMREARRLIRRFAKISPFVYKSLIENTAFLSNVYFIRRSIPGIYAADSVGVTSSCRQFYPAFITFHNGAVVASSNTWSSIDYLSAPLILVHELLRFSQLFNPAFRQMTHQELQRLTAMIASEQSVKKIARHLRPFEENLKSSRIFFAPVFPATTIRSEQIFNSSLLKCQSNKVKLAACLNQLFLDKEYRTEVKNSVRASFL